MRDTCPRRRPSCTSAAFQLVTTMDSIQSLRNQPFHKMQLGTAALTRQSGNVLDIAMAICSRFNCASDFVNQHRVLSLMKGLCRVANSCKAGVVVARCVLRVMVCARLPSAEENPRCLAKRHEGIDCMRHRNRCPTLFESLCSSWPGTGECISLTAISNDLLFKIAVRSDRLYILVAGLVDAFVTALSLRRTNRVPGLNFKELYVQLKMTWRSRN